MPYYLCLWVDVCWFGPYSIAITCGPLSPCPGDGYPSRSLIYNDLQFVDWTGGGGGGVTILYHQGMRLTLNPNVTSTRLLQELTRVYMQTVSPNRSSGCVIHQRMSWENVQLSSPARRKTEYNACVGNHSRKPEMCRLFHNLLAQP